MKAILAEIHYAASLARRVAGVIAFTETREGVEMGNMPALHLARRLSVHYEAAMSTAAGLEGIANEIEAIVRGPNPPPSAAQRLVP